MVSVTMVRAMWAADGFATNGKVVIMADRREKTVVHPALAQLRGYWEGLRARGELPSRNDIDPRGIERALEYAFIAERVAPGVARFRLAGMHLNDLMGMEVRGMPITCFFEPVARDEVQRHIERAFAEPAAVELELESARAIGRPSLGAKMILLPLRGEDGKVLRLLGGMVAEGDLGRAPRRFRLATSLAQPCGRAEPAPATPIGAAGLAENPAPFTPKPERRRGHLRLVHSAD